MRTAVSEEKGRRVGSAFQKVKVPNSCCGDQVGLPGVVQINYENVGA